MQYREGAIGRVFVAKIEHGDDLLKELKGLAEKEKIKSGVMFVIGASRKSSLVTGPKECVVPPEPVWHHFDDGREILAVGTVFWDENEPVLHLHSSVGKGDITLTGCFRGESETYLIIEAVILEIAGINAGRSFDANLGINALRFL